MKQGLLLLLIIASVACSRNTGENNNSSWFQVQIKAARNLDCGLPEIIFLRNQTRAYQIIGNDRGTYIGLGLPKVNYQAGDKLWVKIRKPAAGESVACTMLGITWAHVFISDVK